MAEVKWIKITTDMFDNRKIKHLRKLPDGNSIVLIWVMLLTMAGRCNAGGMIFLTENIPYTPKSLADELGFEESTVQLALDALAKFNMIRTDGFLRISGWDEYQNIEGLERVREQTRLRVARYRERRALADCNATGNVSETFGNETDILEEEKDKELELEKEFEEQAAERINYQSIVDMYNGICKSYPTVRALSDKRKAAIRARLNSYTAEDFRELFTKCEASKFLKGGNDRNWIATFDWMICDSNMAKVLDGNYDNREGGCSSGRNSGSVRGRGEKVWNVRADVE